MSRGYMTVVEATVPTRVTLRRPSHPILGAMVSIPRVSIQKCDQCGNVLSKENDNERKSRRPYSVHVDQENYLQIPSQVRGAIKKISQKRKKSITSWG